ncbi:hypothetical protein PT974_08115 [Cladobotryum mycophilum]|uniref:Uncharacterized protein n=1 Tax=Cladobotryum mycophilum TaxID=491253 RepID=A0ABR0SCG1_9HYPO
MSDYGSDSEDEMPFTLRLPDDVLDSIIQWVEEQVDMEETMEKGLVIRDGVVFHWTDAEVESSNEATDSVHMTHHASADDGASSSSDCNSDTSSMYDYDSDEDSGTEFSPFMEELWGLGFLTEHRFRDFVHRPVVRRIWDDLWSFLANPVPPEEELSFDVKTINSVSRKIQQCWDQPSGHHRYTQEEPDKKSWSLEDHLARFAVKLGPLCNGKGIPLGTCKLSLVWAWAAIEMVDVLRSMQKGYGPDDGRNEVWVRAPKPGDVRDNRMPHYDELRKNAVWLAGLELALVKLGC